jgi:hypothetical protein
MGLLYGLRTSQASTHQVVGDFRTRLALGPCRQLTSRMVVSTTQSLPECVSVACIEREGMAEYEVCHSRFPRALCGLTWTSSVSSPCLAQSNWDL